MRLEAEGDTFSNPETGRSINYFTSVYDLHIGHVDQVEECKQSLEPVPEQQKFKENVKLSQFANATSGTTVTSPNGVATVWAYFGSKTIHIFLVAGVSLMGLQVYNS